MNTSAFDCEVNVDGAWQVFSLKDAQRGYRDALKRCPHCHGRVTVMGIYNAAGNLALTHRRAHDGCPLIQKRYRGMPKRHPEPVE